MNNFAQEQPGGVFAAVVSVVFSACLLVWMVIFQRWLSGKPVLPYQPRRPVPWRIWDLLAIAFFYFAGLIGLIHLADICMPDLSLGPPLPFETAQTSTAHPLVQLLAMKNWTAIILCSVAGILVAPIVEEMFFRVLFQGWLEKVERNWRRRWPILRRLTPLAVMPILVSSIFFAGQHFREAAPPEDVQYLMFLLAGHGMVSLLSLLFGIAWLYWQVGATAADLGWDPQKFFADLRVGIIAFLAVVVPTFLGQYILSQLLPAQFAPDPITLFFLAIALGLLYYRTHRVVPAIVVHLALNASSLIMAIWS